MSRPQKTNVYKANATALGDMAQPLRDAATKMLESADRVHNTVYDFEWEGEAKTAADGRADRELVQDRAVATKQLALAEAYDNAAKTMQPMIDSLKSKGQGLEADDFAVSEDWVVTDTYDYDTARKLAPLFGLSTADVDAIQTKRANDATTETTNLQKLADELGTADANASTAINNAKGELAEAAPQAVAGLPHVALVDDPLAPGGVRILGPVAGTGANPGIPGIGAADLGEVVRLPNGKYVAIFGDSFSGHKMGEGDHYPSVAVPVRFENGKMVIDGPPLTGPDGKNVLFRPPPEAAGTDTLPAGSIQMRDGTTYMMVAGTNALKPTGGSWLTKVTSDPTGGWQPAEGSWRSNTPYLPDGRTPNPNYSPVTQISGYQAADGNVYIAADSFDRSQPVTMYRVDPEHVADRNAWQPWTGTGWGNPGEAANTPISASNYGELSFREVQGQPVLSGFNNTRGSEQVEVYVGSGSPTSIFDSGPTVVAHNDYGNTPVSMPQPYGGYILPGSTLDDMNILVSQWNTTNDIPYEVQQVQVNPTK